MENEDYGILNTTGLSEEIAGEVEVFNIRNNEIERMTSDGENGDVEPSAVKKQKQNAKKIQDKYEMTEAAYTNTNKSFDQDKNAQAFFQAGLVELTMWTSFGKVVSPLIQLLLPETNQYANRDKNKSHMKVTLEELKNFIGLIFLSG